MFVAGGGAENLSVLTTDPYGWLLYILIQVPSVREMPMKKDQPGKPPCFDLRRGGGGGVCL